MISKMSKSFQKSSIPCVRVRQFPVSNFKSKRNCFLFWAVFMLLRTEISALLAFCEIVEIFP